MQQVFEIIGSDLGGRIGVIHTGHGRVRTPAFVPVIHPVQQTIPAAQIGKMGFEMVITNAYITMKRYGDEAIQRGIHDIIGFEGPVMTDSGGYQVLEYGDLDITADEMAAYQVGIRSDLPIPLDKPTSLGLSKDIATDYVNHTLQVCKDTMDEHPDSGHLWVGPIQGSEYGDLVQRSTDTLVHLGYQMAALGSPVEFMESYDYRNLAAMIVEARKSLPAHIPLHLFGAGHPITIPLAIALGCDTFDSASYILYAKQNRYITSDGTRHLDDIELFPCCCPVCSSHTPSDMASAKDTDRINLIAQHNLYTIKLEVDATIQAIHEGRLWEYVTRKARAHPRLYEAMSVLKQDIPYLQAGTARFKQRAIFLFDAFDQYRPEAVALRAVLESFVTKKRRLHIMPMPHTKPAYMAGICQKAAKDDTVQVCVYQPHLGIIPLELSDMYPAAHHLATKMDNDPALFPTFGQSWRALLHGNSFDEITYDTSDVFVSHFVESKNEKEEKQL